MRVTPSIVRPGHPDYDVLNRIRRAVFARVGGPEKLAARFPALVREAIDFVLDPVRTARTRMGELDSIEKTFVGLKIEHMVRDMLDVPKGVRDLVIDGIDVDIKNTVGGNWMIPPETYRGEDACLVIASEEATHRCWMGLILARNSYLNAPNRDKKRSVKGEAFKNILWLVEGAPYPVNRWASIDMDRFRELRKIHGGTKRAVAFFSENLRLPVHRDVIHSLILQHDYMKRLRQNGGARDILRNRGIALLSGIYDAPIIHELGLPAISSEEMIAIAPSNKAEEALLRRRGLII
ncbi:MAG TPA: NaeI family type II restriction endonuclease [Bryobacteraceae bacterium]|nr:NaeI family type II restriction endonuclease [Bryobacteraceae bacterium]